MSAQGYFADSGSEFVKGIVLLYQNKYKNVLSEVPLVTFYWMFSSRQTLVRIIMQIQPNYEQT